MDELEKALDFKDVIDRLNSRIAKFIPGAKDHLAIKNVILMTHNAVEGILNLLLSRYYLGKEIEKTDKDKVNHFWINVLVDMSFNRKTKILKETGLLKENIINALDRINRIRNDIAHYPHRGYKRGDGHLLYNGKHVFEDVQALELFYNDFDAILKEAHKCIVE